MLSIQFLAPMPALQYQRASADTNRPSPAPFLQFRNRTLDYAGPERDESEPVTVKEIAIAWFGPSDLTDQQHGGLWWAASLAVQEANARGGYHGRPFRLLPCWSENPWGTGVSQMARQVYQERPWAILGSVDGPTTHLAEQIVAKARLPLVSPVSTDISVNLAGVAWMFSCAPGDDQLARLIAKQVAAEYPNASNRCVLFSATDHDSRLATKEILRALSQQNRSPHHRFDFDPNNSNLTAQLDALKNAAPNVIIVSAGSTDAARLVKAIREHHIQGGIFGTAPMGRRQFLSLAGSAAEGVRFPRLFQPRPAHKQTEPFLTRFKSQFGCEPDYAEAHTYDAATLLLQAVCSSSLNRAHIRQALSQISPWQGITGPIQWDGTGQNTRAVTQMGIISKGRVHVLDSLRKE